MRVLIGRGVCDLDVGLRFIFGVGAGKLYWVCSTFKILHDLSSNRREPGWFLSIMEFYTLVREDQVFGIILCLLNIINWLFWQISALDLESVNVNF